MMAIYVDPIFEWPGPRGNRFWCHMGTDTVGQSGIDELFAMVRKIGVRTDYFQHHDPTHPHFDLFPSKRRLAVACGALELPSTRVYSKVCHAPHWVAFMESTIADTEEKISRGVYLCGDLEKTRAEIDRLRGLIECRGIWGDDDDESNSDDPEKFTLRG